MLIVDSRATRRPVIFPSNELVHREEWPLVVTRSHSRRECRGEQLLTREVRWRRGDSGIPELDSEHERFARTAHFSEQTDHIGHRHVESCPVAVLCLTAS
ncbi:hypothetical protein SRABI128_04335 [Microbacterium sp. Bi128]|nr:hypothetical protein SRABI128_04335 [Microbacterium sp. Bi128]